MLTSRKSPYKKIRLDSNSSKLFKRWRPVWIIGVILFGFFLIKTLIQLVAEAPTSTTYNLQVTKLKSSVPPQVEIKPRPVPQQEPEKPEERYHQVKGKIVRNQNLSHLLRSKGIPLNTVLKLVEQTRSTYNLNNLRAGQPYSIELTTDGQLVSFVYQADEKYNLRIERKGDGFTSRLIKFQYEIQLETLEGVIKDNLISAMLEAGGNYQLAIDLEEIFSWQINFFKDLRPGDSFKVLVEKRFLKQQFSSFGKIKATTFQNRRKNLAAVHFKPEGENDGYYTPEGRSIKKQFLKSPLKYTRITSGFTLKRFHPIYKRHMSHQAVDYAAPRGTPIYAISDGKVLSVSRNKRSGKYVKLKHRNGYESSYSHLSKYGNHLLKGKKVQQGQIIGYVGSTGAATGPHLCFKLRKNGRSVNPLLFQSPGGPDLEEKHRATFLAIALQRMRILGVPLLINSRAS